MRQPSGPLKLLTGKKTYEVLSFHPASDWFVVLAIAGDDKKAGFFRIAGWALVRSDEDAPLLVGVEPSVANVYAFCPEMDFDNQFLGYVHKCDLKKEALKWEDLNEEWKEQNKKRKEQKKVKQEITEKKSNSDVPVAASEAPPSEGALTTADAVIDAIQNADRNGRHPHPCLRDDLEDSKAWVRALIAQVIDKATRDETKR
jgi:hypothetical protein